MSDEKAAKAKAKTATVALSAFTVGVVKKLIGQISMSSGSIAQAREVLDLRAQIEAAERELRGDGVGDGGEK